MRIAIHSASDAVRRTLETIIAQSGHHFTADVTSADLLIEDMLNPAKANHTHPKTLQLVAHSTNGDSIICPFRPQSLIQRLTMLGSTQTILLGHGWTLDIQTRSLSNPTAATFTLTEKECALLNQLAAAYPNVMSREELLEYVWGMVGDIDTHTLETHIYRLRAKLELLNPTPCDIVTQGGAYVLVFGEKTQ